MQHSGSLAPQRSQQATAVLAFLRSDWFLILSIVLGLLVVRLLVLGNYGWHRDELDTLDNARYLAWGYIAYPPLTPAIARLGRELFGASLFGIRLFPALAQSIALFLVGVIAREMGGTRFAITLAMLAAAASPVALTAGWFLGYLSFDFLWVVLAFTGLTLTLRREEPRWWLLTGAAIGLGMMTKYTMAFFALSLAAAVLLTPARQQLKSPWLWAGAALAILIFLPNLIWQIQHDFIALDFLGAIHERDIEWGRTEGFLIEQLYLSMNLIAVPLGLLGLYVLFFDGELKPFRALAWSFLISFLIFLALQGRAYYTGPAYPMLLAAGACWLGPRIAALKTPLITLARGGSLALILLGLGLMLPISMPIAKPGSELFRFVDEINSNYSEMLGWPELVAEVARIYNEIPASEQPVTAILAVNYGEAGAVNLYGPAYGLPEAISGVNNYWYRGYGDPPPQQAIVIGFERSWALMIFSSCTTAGQVPNPLGLDNEESWRPLIQFCTGPRASWEVMWPEIQGFG